MFTDKEYEEAVISMRNRSKHMECDGDYWSNDDRKRLRCMFNEGVGITKMAILLQRTEQAIAQQIKVMDLYQSQIYPMRKRTKGKNPTCMCQYCKLGVKACPLHIPAESRAGGKVEV